MQNVIEKDPGDDLVDLEIAEYMEFQEEAQ